MTALSKAGTETFTIEVEAEDAARFQAAARDRGISVSELIVGMADWTLSEQEMAAQEPFTPEQIAEIEQAIIEAENGETFTHEEVMARLRERFPAQTGRQIINEALASYAELLSYVADLPILHEDADRLVAEGVAAMERGDEIDQAELFADWRKKYG